MFLQQELAPNLLQVVVGLSEYTLQKAFPSEYSIGDFDASSNDVVISTLVLQHHGIIETIKTV